MLIGAHVKHKFMLKAEMLSSSRARYAADSSCLRVPVDGDSVPWHPFDDNIGIDLPRIIVRPLSTSLSFRRIHFRPLQERTVIKIHMGRLEI